MHAHLALSSPNPGVRAMCSTDTDTDTVLDPASVLFCLVCPGDSKFYDTKLALVKSWDLQWAYLSAFFFCRMVSFLNTYPTIFKSRVMRGSDGNLRANM